MKIKKKKNPLSTIFQLDFGTVLTMKYFLFYFIAVLWFIL